MPKCDCEASYCEFHDHHEACHCPNEASAGKVMFFGIRMNMCNDCVLRLLVRYEDINVDPDYKPDRCTECGFVLPAHQHYCSQRSSKG